VSDIFLLSAVSGLSFDSLFLSALIFHSFYLVIVLQLGDASWWKWYVQLAAIWHWYLLIVFQTLQAFNTILPNTPGIQHTPTLTATG